MTTFDEATLIDDWAAAWSSSDADKVVALFTDDCVYEDVTMGIVNRGKEELKSFAKTFSGAFSDMKFELQTRFVSGTLGSAEWTASGTHTGDAPGLPATNKYVSLRGARVFELQGDKIRRCSDYWDMVTLLKQTGLMPSG
jgi:steroid delta-isomerase-like uncharacterized protein